MEGVCTYARDVYLWKRPVCPMEGMCVYGWGVTYGIDVYLWKEHNCTHCSSTKNAHE